MSHSIEAEQSILSAILVDPENNIGVMDNLDDEHFSIDAHKAIFKAIREGFEKKEYHDVISLGEALQGRSELQSSGGMEYLITISEGIGSLNPLHVRNYWKILNDHKIKRRMITAAESILRAVNEIKDVDELSDYCQQQLNVISQDVKDETINMSKALDTMLERIQYLSELEDGELVGMTTGVDELDRLTMGRQAGLHIIAGRPAMGKSVLVMQAVDRAAEQGKSSLVFSLEMPVDQLITRSVSAAASLDMQKLKDPRKMTNEDNMKLATGVSKLKDLPIEYVDDFDTKISRICQIARSWHRRTDNHGCIVIDYLQLLDTDQRVSKADGVSEVTRRLKKLSNELSIPVLLVSQLNRSLEQRPNKRPINSDLRDSGAIEQDADSITFVYRDEAYDENSKYKGVAELIIGKQRNGPTGTVYASSELMYQRFGNLIDWEPPEPEQKSSRRSGAL